MVQESQYEEIVVKQRVNNGKINQYFSLIRQLFSISKTHETGAEFFFQYPHINPSLMPIVMPFFRQFKKSAIIHDINSVRVKGHLSIVEKIALSYFDELYVHSENMKKFLAHHLNKKIEYKVIGCFPYIAAPSEEERVLSKNVVFAGNLDKSKFLRPLIEFNKDIDILLYGAISDFSIVKGKAQYVGKFMPNSIQHIKGSWGLVWDGDSIECCSGNYGKYLHIIAPHKFSLYMAAGIPVIVWNESAMSSLVKKHGLGVTVSSLAEMNDQIGKITEQQYNDMLKNIAEFRKIMNDIYATK